MKPSSRDSVALAISSAADYEVSDSLMVTLRSPNELHYSGTINPRRRS
jgi:hypothetical protein